MAGPDPAIHANTGQVAFAWMPASRAGMTERQVMAGQPCLPPPFAMAIDAFFSYPIFTMTWRTTV
jgi:hypothetical protein